LSDPRLYWVAFSLVKGIGAVRFQALLDFFGDPRVAWEAPTQALREAGLSNKIVENLVQLRTSISLEKVWERLQALGISVLISEDEAYPRRLKEIDQPPPVLYLRGCLYPEDEWAVAVVGTRRITTYGRQVAEEVAGMLARNGVTVVSGLARGVDSVAHQAALNAGGRTLAVLGNGVDHVYPPNTVARRPDHRERCPDRDYRQEPGRMRRISTATASSREFRWQSCRRGRAEQRC
jgi:DNA processing protein